MPTEERSLAVGVFGIDDLQQYEEGTLVIDLVEEDERRLVWRGSGARRLSRDSNPERVTERVNEAVNEILAQFPPK